MCTAAVTLITSNISQSYSGILIYELYYEYIYIYYIYIYIILIPDLDIEYKIILIGHKYDV